MKTWKPTRATWLLAGALSATMLLTWLVLVADPHPELVRGDVGGLVGEVGVADDRHAAHRPAVLHLDRHVAEVGAYGRVLVAAGVFPGDVDDAGPVDRGVRCGDRRRSRRGGRPPLWRPPIHLPRTVGSPPPPTPPPARRGWKKG